MSVVSASRWKIDPNEAHQILRDAAPLLKQQGAQSVHLGRIQSGDHAGQVTVITTYANNEEFGRAMDKQRNDQPYQQLFARALKAGELLSRTTVHIEEIG